MFDSQIIDLPRVKRDHDFADALALLRTHGALVVEAAAAQLPFNRAVNELEPWFERAFTGTGPFFGRRTKRFSGVFAKAPATAHLACEPFVLALVEAALKGPDP